VFFLLHSAHQLPGALVFRTGRESFTSSGSEREVLIRRLASQATHTATVVAGFLSHSFSGNANSIVSETSACLRAMHSHRTPSCRKWTQKSRRSLPPAQYSTVRMDLCGKPVSKSLDLVVGGLNAAGLSADYIGHVGRKRGTDRFTIGVSGFVLSFFDRFEDAFVTGT
jgi:hypothetical protein